MRTALALTAALLLAVPAAVAQDPPGTDLFKTVKEKVGAGKPFTLLVTVKLKDGMTEKFQAAAAKVIAGSRAEKGCRQYDFFRSTEEPNTYHFVEKWADLAALETHFKADYLTTFLAALGELLDGPPKIVVATPLESGK